MAIQVGDIVTVKDDYGEQYTVLHINKDESSGWPEGFAWLMSENGGYFTRAVAVLSATPSYIVEYYDDAEQLRQREPNYAAQFNDEDELRLELEHTPLYPGRSIIVRAL